MTLPANVHNLLVDAAKKAGFPIAGTVDIDLALADPDSVFQSHVENFDQWLESGYAGEMAYLSRGRDRRADPRLVFPKAQSMLCVAIPYSSFPAGAPSSKQGPRYARYLRGDDYHVTIKEKLERMMKEVETQFEETDPLEWKVCVDTSAILERTWAVLAGLGWIGKNTMLIHPQYGSYLFLAEVLINKKTGRGPSLLPNYCGNCSKCLTACPTKAIQKPRELNATRCISYWTLEKRGDLLIDEQDKTNIGPWVAGCDICQEVCPFNLKRSKAETSAPTLIDATTLDHWESLLAETEDDYKKRVKNSALNRVKPAQFKRNLQLALKNLPEDLPKNR